MRPKEPIPLKYPIRGPVDVNIKCAGNATGRSTDMVNSSALSADLPKQPAEYDGEVIVEAEDMDYKNIKSCVLDLTVGIQMRGGNAGNGFMDMGTNTAGSLRHTVNIHKAIVVIR